MKIILSPAASEDLISIFMYIAQDDPKAAIKNDDTITEDIKKLASFPQMGNAKPEWTSLPLLFLSSQSRYWIIYTWDQAAKRVEIVRIAAQRRDVPALLNP